MKGFVIASAVVGIAATAASVASGATGVPWSDSFESGVGSSYQAWPGSNESNLLGDNSHAQPGGTQSARAFAADPEAYSSTYTLSSGTSGITGGVSTDVYVYEDNDVAQSSGTPVNAMLAFAGANGTATPGFGGDYAELGIISGNSANVNDYVIRVASYDAAHGTTWFDTGVGRTQGWTHLQIVADPLASAGGDGDYHFYINGNLVDPTGVTLTRNNVGLEWDRIGSNSKSYENFWYDSFNVQAVPEPVSGIGCAGVIGAAAMIRRRKRS